MHFADLFYAVSHTQDGNPRAHPPSTAFALAASLLAELVNIEAIVFADGTMHINGVRAVYKGTPVDPLTRHIFDMLDLSPQQPLKHWLRHLAYTAPGLIAQRILRAGQLHSADGIRFEAIDPQQFEAPFYELKTLIADCAPLPWQAPAIIDMALMCGMKHLLADPEPGTQLDSYLAHVVSVSRGGPHGPLMHAVEACVFDTMRRVPVPV